MFSCSKLPWRTWLKYQRDVNRVQNGPGISLREENPARPRRTSTWNTINSMEIRSRAKCMMKDRLVYTQDCLQMPSMLLYRFGLIRSGWSTKGSAPTPTTTSTWRSTSTSNWTMRGQFEPDSNLKMKVDHLWRAEISSRNVRGAVLDCSSSFEH